jgi:hypothetical protein
MRRTCVLGLLGGLGLGLLGVAAPRSAQAVTAVTCEFNACRTSSGNCDLVDLHYNCSETTEGCTSYSCSGPE